MNWIPNNNKKLRYFDRYRHTIATGKTYRRVVVGMSFGPVIGVGVGEQRPVRVELHGGDGKVVACAVPRGKRKENILLYIFGTLIAIVFL